MVPGRIIKLNIRKLQTSIQAQILRKPAKKRSPERHRSRWEGNNKINLK
jgi:hypothetical protein